MYLEKPKWLIIQNGILFILLPWSVSRSVTGYILMIMAHVVSTLSYPSSISFILIVGSFSVSSREVRIWPRAAGGVLYKGLLRVRHGQDVRRRPARTFSTGTSSSLLTSVSPPCRHVLQLSSSTCWWCPVIILFNFCQLAHSSAACCTVVTSNACHACCIRPTSCSSVR